MKVSSTFYHTMLINVDKLKQFIAGKICGIFTFLDQWKSIGQTQAPTDASNTDWLQRALRG